MFALSWLILAATLDAGCSDVLEQLVLDQPHSGFDGQTQIKAPARPGAKGCDTSHTCSRSYLLILG